MTHATNNQTTKGKHILFLDGQCVFCQKSARTLHHLDKHQRIHFAPLQGTTATALPSDWRLQDNTSSQDTINPSSGDSSLKETTSEPPIPSYAVLSESLEDEIVLWRGPDAILRSLKLMGGIGVIFWPLHLFPSFLKNGVYQFIAKNRYRIAGKTNTCSIPDESFKQMMLP